MLIAHLPAGYLLTQWLQKKFTTQKYLWIGLVASILPDIDMLYFYLIDDRQTPHHEYWTHLPLVWIALWILFSTIGFALKIRAVIILSTIFFANIILHFILDTFVGGINWLYPLVDHSLVIFTVPATHSFWIWSFLLHWTFLFELAIVIAAFVVWRKNKRQ